MIAYVRYERQFNIRRTWLIYAILPVSLEFFKYFTYIWVIHDASDVLRTIYDIAFFAVYTEKGNSMNVLVGTKGLWKYPKYHQQ